MRLPSSLTLLLCWALGSQASAQEGFRLREINVLTRDVFSEDEAETRWFYRLVNGLHVPTHPDVVRKALWYQPGDLITEAEVIETERVLRRFGWFGEVDVTTQPIGNEDLVDLNISTRDRLSLVANGTLTFVGGESRFNAAFGDVNLFGSGKSLIANLRRTALGESADIEYCLLYTSPSPRDRTRSRMPSSA